MPMYLQALASAVPPHCFRQEELWALLPRTDALKRLTSRSLALLRRVLTTPNGITTRHFAAPDPARLFSETPEALARYYEATAPALGATALRRALTEAGIAPGAVDALLVCSCTGYLCPGPSSHVAEQAGLRRDCYLADMVGLGCGAAIPTLRAAQGFLAVHPGATVAVVAVEICSAAFYLDDDPGVLISACLFGDGASASLWRATPPALPTGAASGPVPLQLTAFDTDHYPEHRDTLRFENCRGYLRNLLHKTVPLRVGEAARALFGRLPGPRPQAIVPHAGGRDVLVALGQQVPGYAFDAAARVLDRCGNMSSPSVLFALEEQLASGRGAPGERWWLTSYGAGFAIHGAVATFG